MAKESSDLAALRSHLAALASAEAGPMDGPVPARWLREPTYRCTNTHVSKHFVQGRRGRLLCVFKYCQSFVLMTFPEDRSGPLLVRRVASR